MAEHAEKKASWREPYVLRRVLYTLLALVFTVLGAAGVITFEQADSWLLSASTVIQFVGGAGFSIAATKTHRGSDDTSTAGDVEEAARSAREDFKLNVEPAIQEAAGRLREVSDRVGDFPVFRGDSSTG